MKDIPSGYRLRHYALVAGLICLAVPFFYERTDNAQVIIFFAGIFLVPCSLGLIIFGFLQDKYKKVISNIDEKILIKELLGAMPKISDELISYSKRFEDLSLFYGVQKGAAFYNLERVAEKQPLSRLIPFQIHNAERFFSYKQDGKTFALIFGEIDHELKFNPEITEQILGLHGVINYTNGVINLGGDRDFNLVPQLQHALLQSYFLQQTFLYYSKKAGQPKAVTIDEMRANTEARGPMMQEYIASFKSGLNNAMQCVIDIEDINARLKKYSLKDYSWMDEDATGGRTVNNYLLPASYAKTYLAHAARQQAGAIAR